MTQRLLVSLLVVFFGSATVAVARARQIVSIADNAVLTSPGASIDFPAVDVRLVSERIEGMRAIDEASGQTPSPSSPE